MKVNKAVITAAGRDHNRLPLQVFVHSDGAQKPEILIILEEVASAGIDEASIIVTPDEAAEACVAANMAWLLRTV